MGKVRWGITTPDQTIKCDGCESPSNLKLISVVLYGQMGAFFFCTPACFLEWVLAKEGVNVLW